MTSDVFSRAPTPRNAPAKAHLEGESDSRSENMYQKKIAANKALIDVSHILVAAKKMLRGNMAHKRAASFPAVSPATSRPPRYRNTQVRLAMQLWIIKMAIADAVL